MPLRRGHVSALWVSASEGFGGPQTQPDAQEWGERCKDVFNPPHLQTCMYEHLGSELKRVPENPLPAKYQVLL